MAKTKRSKQNQAWSGHDHAARMDGIIANSRRKKRKKEMELEMKLQQKQMAQQDQQENHGEESADNIPKASTTTTTNDNKKQKKKQHRIIVNVDEENDYRRTAFAHGRKQQIDTKKLNLHIVKIQREIDDWRFRLKNFDEISEKKRMEETLEKERLAELKKEEYEEVEIGIFKRKKRKKRPGPETWKLRGAARPAQEVYDFDTRYVDPHLKAHEEDLKKQKRSRNLFLLCKGRFGVMDDQEIVPQPYCVDFLSLLVQLGHLCVEAKKFKMAREAFLECMELEGEEYNNNDGSDDAGKIIKTNARAKLMRMYMEANRPDSARRLYERLKNDQSAWIRFSAALVEYVSWNLLQEKDSTQEKATQMLEKAIQANIYCAYYIAFHHIFVNVMEYTEDVEEDSEDGTLMEAIEYCNSEQIAFWLETEGALEWVQQTLVQIFYSNTNGEKVTSSLTRKDLDSWKLKLKQEEDAFIQNRKSNTTSETSDDTEEDGQDEIGDNSDNDDDEEVDFLMFSGMFRTSMEMLEDSGDFTR